MQGLPLEIKIKKKQLRLQEWYEHFGGEVYISFSGGKDSTVLLDIARKMYPDIQAVFVDTGLEYPEIREFVKKIDNVEWIKPEKDFKTVILEKGYPVISKETALTIYYARKGSQCAINKLNGIAKTDFGRGLQKYKYLLDAPFRISHICCQELKKKPVHKYERETKKVPIIATMAYESLIRRQSYLRTGCNSFFSKRPISHPLGFWLEKDIWDYIHKFNIPYSSIYDKGYERTGCMFCMFGCHLEKEPNRFQKMQFTHPKLWEYCLKPISDGGLGMAEVLDYIDVPYKCQAFQLKLNL